MPDSDHHIVPWWEEPLTERSKTAVAPPVVHEVPNVQEHRTEVPTSKILTPPKMVVPRRTLITQPPVSSGVSWWAYAGAGVSAMMLALTVVAGGQINMPRFNTAAVSSMVAAAGNTFDAALLSGWVYDTVQGWVCTVRPCTAPPSIVQGTTVQNINEPTEIVPFVIGTTTASDRALQMVTVYERPQQIIQQPVTERVIERVVKEVPVKQTVYVNTGSGQEVDTSLFLNALTLLDEKLSRQIIAVSNTIPAQQQLSGGGAAAPSYNNTFGLSQKIDTLTNTQINNPTISGGTISGVTIDSGLLGGVVVVGKGGTGTTTAPSYGQMLLGNASGGYDLVATSSLGITGGATFGQAFEISGGYLAPTTTLTILANGGLVAQASSTIGSGVQAEGLTIAGGATTTGSMYIAGNLGIGTTSPYAKLSVVGQIVGAYFTATTTATSTFAGGIQTNALNVTSTTATSTFANGINLSTGCFSINGTCISAGGSGITGIGPTGQSQTGPSITLATSTTGTDFTITASGNTITYNIPTASSANRGLLSTSDWSLFNNKVSSTSIDTSAEVASLVTDETGSGALVFGTNATLSSTTLSGNTLLSNATTSSFAITSLTSTLLKTTSNGTLTAAISGTDYATPAQIAAAYPFQVTGNATSTLTQFNGGLTSYASTTIGSGAQAGGLTISGGATTTGNMYVVGNIYSAGVMRADTYNDALNSVNLLRYTGGNTVLGPAGNIGIGTTTPFRKLSLTDAVSTAQTAIAYDATRYTDLLTDSVGDFTINPQGDDVRLNDDNMWVCAGGSCPTGTPSGNGNLIVESRLGIGTSTPDDALHILNPTSVVGDTQLLLEGQTNAYGTGLSFQSKTSVGGALVEMARIVADGEAAWNTTASTQDAFLRFYTTADGTTAEQMRITSSGRLGIGTTSPTQQLSVQNLLYVGAGGATGMGTATSTFQGDIKITGKLDVGTIDPVYTIGGVKYATYGASTIGVKEEVAFKVHVDAYDQERQLYAHVLEFSNQERGSDLWLFYQVTNFGEAWKDLVVSLTPAFEGVAFYEENHRNKTLTIFTSRPGDVSVRFIAPRYDAVKWPNLRDDQYDPFTHHTLDEK